MLIFWAGCPVNVPAGRVMKEGWVWVGFSWFSPSTDWKGTVCWNPTGWERKVCCALIGWGEKVCWVLIGCEEKVCWVLIGSAENCWAAIGWNWGTGRLPPKRELDCWLTATAPPNWASNAAKLLFWSSWREFRPLLSGWTAGGRTADCCTETSADCGWAATVGGLKTNGLADSLCFSISEKEEIWPAKSWLVLNEIVERGDGNTEPLNTGLNSWDEETLEPSLWINI